MWAEASFWAEGVGFLGFMRLRVKGVSGLGFVSFF